MSITLTRSNFLPVTVPNADGSIRKALTDVNIALRNSIINRGSLSVAELRRTVTEAIHLENAVFSGTADLSAFTRPHPAVSCPNSDQVETIRLRALGRVMSRLIGSAQSRAVSGWWIPQMSAIIGDRPGLHMDARDALTARFGR